MQSDLLFREDIINFEAIDIYILVSLLFVKKRLKEPLQQAVLFVFIYK